MKIVIIRLLLMVITMKTIGRLFTILVLTLSLQGCVGFLIGQAADVAVETAKVPFKIGGAVVDVATGGDDE